MFLSQRCHLVISGQKPHFLGSNSQFSTENSLGASRGVIKYQNLECSWRYKHHSMNGGFSSSLKTDGVTQPWRTTKTQYIFEKKKKSISIYTLLLSQPFLMTSLVYLTGPGIKFLL